ncbi:MAG: hypothetical protein DI538_14785 [Azospira oryzae]|jgi:hypothetical protein|nr:MAG: hypothetical protein DI538_14785 [Azospira oryzae]
MDYTYQNAPADKPLTIILNEFTMTVRTSGQEEVFPYSQIVAVQLDRSERNYKTMLITESSKIIVITNKSYLADRTPRDQSRAYTTFVRVLHFHLKDKSRAVFTSGNKNKIWMLSLISILITVVISFTVEHFGWGLVNPYLQAGTLAAIAGIVILALNMDKWPRAYQPTDIPLEFLPE